MVSPEAQAISATEASSCGDIFSQLPKYPGPEREFHKRNSRDLPVAGQKYWLETAGADQTQSGCP